MIKQIADAVGELMGLNRYSYANNNPVNLTDPSGMIAERPEQWGTCRQTADDCITCMQDYLNDHAPANTAFWGPYYYAAWSACSNKCLPYGTSPTPTTGTPRPTAFPTNTPYPTNTPTPTATPSSAWTVPMAQACFSDIEYTTREGCTGQCVPSQDINRRQPGNYPVVAPANGEVMIVDIVDVDGGNANRGNFVAIRIPINNVPLDIRNSIPELKDQTQGYVYLGYAHLSQVDVSVEMSVSSGQQLGVSGQTGLENVPGAVSHLDIAMFYTPFSGSPTVFGSSASKDHNTFNALAYQQNHYPLGTSLPLDVQPSLVWPELIGTCP